MRRHPSVRKWRPDSGYRPAIGIAAHPASSIARPCSPPIDELACIACRRWTRAALFALIALLTAAGDAYGQNISRTITVDGVMDDWYAAPDITTNQGQYSEDCVGSDPCDLDFPVQSSGRDLRKFAYTWDNENLYLYVERYASGRNTTTWLFYIDGDVDGKLQTGERIVAIDWWGSNRRTNATLCSYIAAHAAGDTILGDGNSMPGSSTGCAPLYENVIAGSIDGNAMEARLPWSALGASGPSNVMFHIASSAGFSNLPQDVRDNMNGPVSRTADGKVVAAQLFPPDMTVSITGYEPEIGGFQEVTMTFELRNIYYDPFSQIQIALDLPPELEYVRDRSPPGSDLIDNDGDGLPEIWAVDSLRAKEVLVLELDLRAKPIPFGVDRAVSVSIASWTGTDTYPENNDSTVMVHILPSPDLVVVKSANTAEATPGTTVIYTVLVTNTSHAPAHEVLVQGSVGAHLYFGLETFGAGQPFRFTDGDPASTLTLEAPEYSDDGGASWGYVPVSGAGGAPAGFDGSVTHWRIPMAGVMATHGANFEVRFGGWVR